MECVVIKKIPGIRGCYGDRFEVNTKSTRAIRVFEAISVWTTKTVLEMDGSKTITYELPIGYHIEENPLIMFWLWGYRIDDPLREEEYKDEALDR